MRWRRCRRNRSRTLRLSRGWRRRWTVPAATGPARLSAGALEVLAGLRPVDDIPPGVDVVGPLVLVLQVVGVLPDVDADDRRVAVGDGSVLVRGRHHRESR